MPRLSSEQWREAQIAWEADPCLTATDIARKAGVARTAVVRQIDKGWRRRTTFEQLAERAQFAADRKTATNQAVRLVATQQQNVLPSAAADVSWQPDVSHIPTKRADGLAECATVSAAHAVDARAEVIARHRAEWQQHTRLLDDAIRETDFEKAKIAKITAETIAIRQAGERKAWGLDAYTEPSRETFPTIPDDAYAKVRQRAEAKRIERCGPDEPDAD